MQPPSGNQRPNLLTSLMNMSLVLRLPRKMHLCRSSSNVPRLPSFWKMLENPHVLLAFDKVVHNPLRRPRAPYPSVSCTFDLVLRATTACTFSTSQLPKAVRTWCALYILTSKMCLAPQRRALFEHLNFPKCSERGAFCILTWKRSSRHSWSDVAVLCTF